MLIGCVVVESPPVSVAFAVIECVPAGSDALTEYGAVVSAFPIKNPSEKNSTLATPASSFAFALKDIVSLVTNVALLAGSRRDTVGGWFCGAFAVMLTGVEVVAAFELSVAFAVMECDPAASDAVTE